MPDATIIHYIDDMDEALAFYKEAMLFESTSESPYWSTVRVSPGLELGLHPAIKKDTGKSDGIHPFDAGDTSLSLDVEDFESYVERIEAHGGKLDRIVTPDHDPTTRIVLVCDPAGNGFQICGEPRENE
jgi:predicted enzyme related to lactoylglutathione lyase